MGHLYIPKEIWWHERECRSRRRREVWGINCLVRNGRGGASWSPNVDRRKLDWIENPCTPKLALRLYLWSWRKYIKDILHDAPSDYNHTLLLPSLTLASFLVGEEGEAPAPATPIILAIHPGVDISILSISPTFLLLQIWLSTWSSTGAQHDAPLISGETEKGGPAFIPPNLMTLQWCCCCCCCCCHHQRDWVEAAK